MRILLLNYEYPPHGGGAGLATAGLARELVQRGIEVDVVTAGAAADGEPHRAGAPVPPTTSDREPRVFRVRTRRRGVHESGFLGAAEYVPAAIPLVRQLLGEHRFDVVHAFFSLPTGVLLPLASRHGVRTLVSLRGSDVPGYDDSNRTLQLAHSLLRPVTRWVWQSADRVVTVCESLGRQAARTVPGLPYTVIGNGVDLVRFHPPILRRPPDGDPLRCIAVSRLVARKGLADLLAAWSLLERGCCKLEIVGSGPAEASLRELASTLKLGDDVRFVGALDRDGLAERLREADVFVLTPHAEAFGNAFAEAMATGLPIIGTTVGGIPEMVRDGENGLLVRPGDARSLVAAVRRVAAQPAWRREMGERNRARAEATLSWARVADQYIQVYCELAGIAPLAAGQGALFPPLLPDHDAAIARR
ncbi:MAG TPA: glycosyltransferase [Gemmatimonadaceae bacterium]|nr:glycosyltransferase [Gemmatimonadaceae bacterium]